MIMPDTPKKKYPVRGIFQVWVTDRTIYLLTPILCAGYSFIGIHPMLCLFGGIETTSGFSSLLSLVNFIRWIVLNCHDNFV
jgi:hypothetical protein